jgi:hypothetical protein
MIKILAGVFLVLHGLVHLLYLGQSARLFVLQPGLTWPDGSWAFSKLLGSDGTRTLAGMCCILAAAGLVVGGAGTLTGQPWWRAVAAAAAGLSGVMYLLFWNGRGQRLADQGGVGLLIDIAILVIVLVVPRPALGF